MHTINRVELEKNSKKTRKKLEREGVYNALCGLRTGNEAITVCGHIQKGAY